MKSAFVEKVVLSYTILKVFEKWFVSAGFHPASELMPGAVHAEEFVADFFRNREDCTLAERKRVASHAKLIGLISDCRDDLEDTELA